MLARQVKTGHEQAFEAVLRTLAAEVRSQPGHLDANVLKPRPPSSTIASYSARRQDADAEVHSDGALQARYLSDWRAGRPYPAPQC